MKFGLFYEHQLPQPWEEGSELHLYQQVRRCAQGRTMSNIAVGKGHDTSMGGCIRPGCPRGSVYVRGGSTAVRRVTQTTAPIFPTQSGLAHATTTLLSPQPVTAVAKD